MCRTTNIRTSNAITANATPATIEPIKIFLYNGEMIVSQQHGAIFYFTTSDNSHLSLSAVFEWETVGRVSMEGVIVATEVEVACAAAGTQLDTGPEDESGKAVKVTVLSVGR